MNILIIEDEETAAERLKKMLYEINEKIRVLEITESISSSIKWLNNNPLPHLIFADINLADGQSFDIFRQVNVGCPIIFTTAYDQYAIEAFKFNSIDYLLKPIKKKELEESLKKYYKINPSAQLPDYNKLLQTLASEKKEFQKRLVVKFGQKILTIEIDDIAYFYTEEKITFACTKDGKRMPVDHRLDELEGIVDMSKFFRINRQFIINIGSINSMHSFSKSRVKIDLEPRINMDTIVSAERSPAFKEWLLGKN